MLVYDDIYYPNMADAIIYKGSLWFVNMVASAIMRVSMEDWEVKEFYLVHEHSVLEGWLYHKIILKDNKLILVPTKNASEIVVFNLDTKEQRYGEIQDEMFFSSVLQHDGKVWLFETGSTDGIRIFTFDPETLEFYSQIAVEECLKMLIPFDTFKKKLASRVITFENKLWFLILDTNYLISIDTKLCKGNLHRIGEGKYHNFTCTNDGLIIAETNTMDVLEWTERDGLIKRRIKKAKTLVDEKYISILVRNNKIIALPYMDPYIIVIDVQSDDIKAISVEINNNIFPIPVRAQSSFFQMGCISEEDNILILPYAGRDLFILNLEKMQIEAKTIRVTKEWSDLCRVENMKEIFEKKYIINEENFSINDYVRTLKATKKKSIISRGHENSIGRRIWENE